MSNKNVQAVPDAGCYGSSVAARLAGVPVETLRVWERRYNVIGPRLSESGRRLYSSDEIHRLSIIKQLVDAGHAVGRIATLPTSNLIDIFNDEKNRRSNQSLSGQGLGAELRTVLIGPWISSRRISEALSHSTLKVVGKCVDLNIAAQELDGTKADIAVIEFPILNEKTIGTIQAVKKACNATHGIIFYRFSPSPVLLELRSAGYHVVRKPLDSVEIEWFCNALMRSPVLHSRTLTLSPTTEAPPPPLFDESSLATFAGAIGNIYCECPRHLIELVLSLKSFESYSADCANRNDNDAALHRDLQWTTGHARAALEGALVRLTQAEGINLPARIGDLS